jgi:peptide/nickel transport system permease protein
MSRVPQVLPKVPAKLWPLAMLTLLYSVVIWAGVLTPYAPNSVRETQSYLPPTPIQWKNLEGHWVAPYVFHYKRVFDAKNLRFTYEPELSKPYPLKFGVRGEAYTMLGVIKSDWHLLGVEAPASLSFLGRDVNGRDNFSRLLHAGQISLFIGFCSLLVSLPLGLSIGALSGYLGGWVDTVLMRLTEVLMSIPSIFLLVSLAALLPASLSSGVRFILVSMLMATIGWTGLARVIRGMVLNIKQNAFVDSARCMGASLPRLIFRHILPQTASYVVVSLTLGVPGYILAESGLSFLGLGIQQPDASWGNMLKEAQELSNLLEHPWMLAPAVFIFLAVWSYNLLGDALRDELDPNVKKLL